MVRLQSRVAELSAISDVLRVQLDNAATAEAVTVREAARALERSEYEVARQRDKLGDMEIRETELLDRIKQMEKEILRGQDALFKKDKVLKEEQQKVEVQKARSENLLAELQEESKILRAAILKAEQECDVLKQSHAKEIEGLQEEVTARIPKIVDAAVSAAEARWMAKNQQDSSEMQNEYELNMRQLKQSLQAQQQAEIERAARVRLEHAEDKVCLLCCFVCLFEMFTLLMCGVKPTM